MSPKIIFVTGGVLSSLGKGISAASLGALLEARGYKVRLRKFEPVFRFLPLQCQICILYIFAHTYMYASLGSSSSAGSAAGAAGAEQILVVTAFLCVQALALSLSPPRSGSMLPEMS